MIKLAFLIFLFSTMNSADFHALTKEGRDALERKDFQTALEKLSKAEAINSQDPDCLNLIGLVHFKLTNYSKAREYFQRSLTIDRENPYTWTTLGHVYYLEGNFVDAVRHYKKALSLDSKYGEAAQFLEQLQAYGETLKTFQKRKIYLLAILFAEILATALLVRILFRFR